MHGLSNCDTVKKAGAWLTQHGVAFDFVDFKRHPPGSKLLEGVLADLSWAQLLNRQSSTWRGLGPVAQAAVVDADSAVLALCAQPSLIKRPLMRWADGRHSVGFSPELFSSRCSDGRL